LRFDVIEDLLDYVWVNDVCDDTHGTSTQWAHGNIDIKDSFESLGPSQGSDQLICRFGFCYRFAFTSIDFWLGFFTFCGNDEFSQSCIWGEYAVIPNEVMPGSGYQRCKFAKKINRRKQDMCGA
jgi:hypothetical protein